MKIHNERKIAILMATYNGEKYLKEQIDSLINQTYMDWTLYIQDDVPRIVRWKSFGVIPIRESFLWM